MNKALTLSLLKTFYNTNYNLVCPIKRKKILGVGERCSSHSQEENTTFTVCSYYYVTLKTGQKIPLSQSVHTIM